MATLDEVLMEIEKDGRICPQPQKWNKLWEMLPNKKRKGAGWGATLTTYFSSMVGPILMKKLRIQEHIRWAEQNEALDSVYEFLKGLDCDDWYYCD